jgi:hypothetical protein
VAGEFDADFRPDGWTACRIGDLHRDFCLAVFLCVGLCPFERRLLAAFVFLAERLGGYRHRVGNAGRWRDRDSVEVEIAILGRGAQVVHEGDGQFRPARWDFDGRCEVAELLAIDVQSPGGHAIDDDCHFGPLAFGRAAVGANVDAVNALFGESEIPPHTTV